MPLVTLPSRLFTSRLQTGEHEFFCYFRLTSEDQDAPSHSIDRIQWQLSAGGAPVLSGTLLLTEQARAAGRIALAATLPSAWEGGFLSVEIPQTGWRASWEVQRLTQQDSYRLPLKGFALVLGGHRIGEVHRMAWQVPSQGFAWDFLPLTPALGLLRLDYSEALRNEDFAGFGAPVLASAAGSVAQVVDGLPDLPYTGGYPDPKDYLGDLYRALGNHVILEHAPGVYSVYGHLQQGSARVSVGASVEAGQPIGALGNSGFSSGPHLHFHFMDSSDLLAAAPLPVQLEVEGRQYAPGAGEIISG